MCQSHLHTASETFVRQKKFGSGSIFCVFASVACILIGKDGENGKTHEKISDSVCNGLNALKIFNAINAGAGLGLATPFTTAASVSFFREKDCVYLDAESLYDHIKRETFQMHALMSPPRQARVKRARKRHGACSARSPNTRTKVPAHAVDCIISYQTAKETMCMQWCSYARAGRYGQNLYHDIFLNFSRYDIIPISIWTLLKKASKTAKNAHNRCLYLQTYEKWICQVYELLL